jgi:hypothetical protein
METKPEEQKSRSRRWWILLAIFGPSLIYAVMRRHWSDFLIFTYLASLPLAVAFMRTEGDMYVEAAKTDDEKLRVIAQLYATSPLLAIFLMPIGSLFYALGATLFDIVRWLVTQLSEQERSAAFAMAVTAFVGAVLFWFRLRYRALYGFTEAVVGLSVAGHRVGFQSIQANDGMSLYLAVLTAGVYLVVRGLDNVHQGWKSGSDPALTWLVQRLRSRLRWPQRRRLTTVSRVPREAEERRT